MFTTTIAHNVGMLQNKQKHFFLTFISSNMGNSDLLISIL